MFWSLDDFDIRTVSGCARDANAEALVSALLLGIPCAPPREHLLTKFAYSDMPHPHAETSKPAFLGFSYSAYDASNTEKPHDQSENASRT